MADLMTTSQDPLKPSDFIHRPIRIALIAFSAFLLAFTLAMNGLSAGGGGGMFQSNQANLSDLFYLSVTPAGWTFSIWGVIYTFQVLWVILSILSIFKRGTQGYLYLTPGVLPASLFLLYIAANSMNIAWLFAFDRQVLELALVCLLAIAVPLWVLLALSIRALHHHKGQMQKEFHRGWTIAIRICLQNGIAMYATWTSIATLLNLAHVMVYRGNVSEASGSTTVLSLLLVELIVFTLIDYGIIDRYFRYLMTPYITFIVALIGSVTNGKAAADTLPQPKTTVNEHFTIGLLVIACLLLLLKLLSWIKKPIGANRV